jgi:hypothetical protein
MQRKIEIVEEGTGNDSGLFHNSGERFNIQVVNVERNEGM